MKIKMENLSLFPLRDYSFEEYCEDNGVPAEIITKPYYKWTWYCEYFSDVYGWDLSITEKNGSPFASIVRLDGIIVYESSLINKDIEKCREDLIDQALYTEKQLKEESL